MYDPNYINWNTKYGWCCPKCGKIYNPEVSQCYYCNQQRKTFASTSTETDPRTIDIKVTPFDDSEWWNEYLKRSTTAKTTKDIDDLIKSTADSASIINPTTTWGISSDNINQATTSKNVKVTAWNGTTTASNIKDNKTYNNSNGTTVDPSSVTVCSQKCEECNKYNKSCFGGIETTESKAIISHRKSPKVTYDFIEEDILDSFIKHFQD